MPIEGADEKTATQLTNVNNWVYQRENVYNLISDAFENALTTGLSLMHVYPCYQNDPISGDLKYTVIPYSGILMDQFTTKQDLSDCNFLWTRKYLSKDMAARLLPKRRKEIMEMRGFPRDDKFIFQPENFNIRNPDLLAYDEVHYLDTRKAKILVDTKSGEVMEWEGEDEDLNGFLRDFPQVKVQTINKPTTRMAITINNRTMYDGPNQLGIDIYPYAPFFCYWDPSSPYYAWKIQGIVRPLRDAQFLYNRRKVIELDILESQINTGMKVMEGALVDPNDALMNGVGRGLFIKSDAPQGMDSVQPLPQPHIDPSAFQVSENLGREMLDISGINEELLGSADDDKAGILGMLRQGAGLTTLEPLFDTLDRSQKLLGQITMQSLQKNFSPGKVRRILNEEPTEQFYSKAFQKYDTVVAEGILTETQRKANFSMQFQLWKEGLPIPVDLLVEEAPVPDPAKLKEAIAKQQQQQQEMAEKQQQLQEQEIQSRINLANARAIADEGLGMERASRIHENQELAVERRAKAIEDISDAKLNRVKTLKELQDIDLSQIEKLVNILKVINEKVEEPAKEAVERTQR